MALRTCSPFQAASLNAIAAAIVVLAAGPAAATEINLGNPDLKVYWDNTVRYTAAMRVDKQDSRILNSASNDEGDSKFDRGDLVVNRVDLLSEVDVAYKGRLGGRLVASAWYDHAYKDQTVRSPASGGVIPTSYFNNTYNSTAKRYLHGPSGEILDAFVWGNVNLGAVPVNVKLGRHAIVWGEGLLLGSHAISYSQAPVDGAKAVANPGIETKEVFLPLNQLSFKAQLSSDVSLAGQYFLQWETTRAPFGGSYYAGADTSPDVDRLGVGVGVALPRSKTRTPSNAGNYGLALRVDVPSLESTFGVYYRQFDDYNPENGLQNLGTSFRFLHAQNVRMIGLSLARPLGPVSFGSELSLRSNAALNTTGFHGSDTGARGTTLHFVANGIYLLPKTALWDTGSFIAELALARLQKVTHNANLYRAEGYATCTKLGLPTGAPAQPGDNSDGCSTRNFAQVAASFSPQWLSILPSWDLTMPMSVNYGLNGTSPTGSGGFEKGLAWSVGAVAMYNGKHEFTLRYSDTEVPVKYNAAGTALVGGYGSGSNNGGTDRGNLSFIYKTSF